MSNEEKKSDAQALDKLPPYERIMRERATALESTSEESATAPKEDKSATGNAEEWATKPMPAQQSEPKEEKTVPHQTLAEAAAKRAAAREEAARLAQEKKEKVYSERAAEEVKTSAGRAAKGTRYVRETAQEKRGKAHVATSPAKKNTQRKQAPKRSKNHRGFPWLVVLMFVCAFVVAISVIMIGRNWLVPANPSDTETVQVEIPSGMVVSEMGDMLKEDGLIRSSGAFSLYVRIKGAAANLQAGTHELSPSMTMAEIVAELQEAGGQAGVVKITVNEGLTIDEIADVVEQSSSYSAEDFLEAVNDETLLTELVQQYPILTESYNSTEVRYVLEGYLFPATYDFVEADGLNVLITQMVDKTNDVLSGYQDEIEASSYSLQDIMSLASLVEKEGQTAEDRKLIAGVFYNRLNAGMAIQSDISVLYALGTHKEMVTYDDLQVDSPYNLYTNTGLPPGPLNSPSEEAIAAALEPTESDYIYFYANLKTGEVFYTDDYEQHLAWQTEYEETGDIQG